LFVTKIPGLKPGAKNKKPPLEFFHRAYTQSFNTSSFQDI